MATSAPVPMATPRSATARAGASLRPSPTIATTRPGREPLDQGGLVVGPGVGDDALARRSPRRRRRPPRSSGRRRSPATRRRRSDGQPPDRLGRAVLDRIVDREQPRHATVDRDEGDGATGAGRLVDAAPVEAVVSMPCSRSQRGLPTSTSRSPPSSSMVPATPLPTLAAKPGQSPEAELVAVGVPHDRRTERVLAPALDARPRSRARSAGRTRRRRPTAWTVGRPAVSVPVLSRTTGRHAVRHLERLAAADQDPRLGAATGPDHDGGRRREAHRARAGDDEDR